MGVGVGGEDKLYYLVASAVRPNYSYAFLTVSLKLFLLGLFTSLLTHCHTSCHSHCANQVACSKYENYCSCHNHNVLASCIILDMIISLAD